MASHSEKHAGLLEAIAESLASPGSKEKLGNLVGKALEHVELGVRDALESIAEAPRDLPECDEIVVGFLGTKLADAKFLRAVTAAKAPGAYLQSSAHHYAIDRLREKGLPPRTTNLESSEGDEEGRPHRQLADPSAGHEDQAMEAELRARARSALDRLSPGDRLLLTVFYSPEALGETELRFLAGTRKTTPDVIRAEVAARVERMETRGQELGDSIEERWAYLRDLGARRARLVQAINELDGEPAKGVAPGKLVTHLSAEEMHAQSPEWRAGQLAALDQRIAQYDRLAAEERRKKSDPVLGRPLYKEVALILGRVNEADGDDRIATAANSVQVEIGRVLRELESILRETEAP